MQPLIWDTDRLDLEALAAEYGTPFYLYDADMVCARIESVRELFRGMAKVYYAVKANPNLELLRAVRSVADGVDISSVGELAQIEQAGFDANVASFAGPAKSRAELAAAIRSGVDCISVESPRELADCAELADRIGRRASVLIRVNPRLLNRSFGMKMGGRPVQFGVDEEELPDFRGIHVYAGSQCFEPEGIVDGVENTLRIVRELEAASDLRCRVVNLGGGFGVAHTKRDTELPLEQTAEALCPVLEAFHRESELERFLIFELGRYLAAPAGLYVTRVMSSKASRGKQFYMVDGGLHHHLAAAGTFGAALRSNFLLRNLSDPQAEAVQCSVAGASCNPTDLLAVEVELPRPRLGDLLGVTSAGSYGLTASPVLFLGRPSPVELVYHGGRFHVGRPAHTILDWN